MRLGGLVGVLTLVGLIGITGGRVGGQTATADELLAAARTAAGTDFVDLFNQLCSVNAGRGGAARGAAARAGGPPAAGQVADGQGATVPGAGATAGRQAQTGPAAGAGRGDQAAGRGAAGGGRGAPDRSTWYAEPVKVFDNLYFVGQRQFSVWAVNTSDGIIVVDTIFDYSVEAEVVDGLKKLGLDPSKIKYAIVSHGHGDHSGGAKFLQDTFGTRIIMGEADWETASQPRPKKDIVATDGMKVTLGNTTLTIYTTPGHTPGTISTVIPVTDGGQRHTALLWGGTLLGNASGGLENYATAARKMRTIAQQQNIDVQLSNHTAYDNSTTKLPAVLARKPGQPHPYVVGTPTVLRFLTMAGGCAEARMAAAKAAAAAAPAAQ